MNKFRDALYRFMYGRNGVDALNWALVILELIVSILSSIIRVQGVSQALYFVSMMLMFIVLIRIFSRNLARRQAENAKFLTWWTPKANAIRGAQARQGAQIRPLLLRRVLPRAEKHRQGRAHVPEVRQEKGRQNVKEKIRPAGRIFL
mgnify:CR=1 FL=1